jgi:DNA modification methylase
MLVEDRPIDSIKPYENNPRDNDAGVAAVAASIVAFGWRVPIVVDEDDVILAGHTRHKAAKKLGMTTVPVHVARGLTPEQARAYRIADNQTAAYSSWDDGKLALELAALQAAGFDLSATAFPEDELLRLLTAPPGESLTDPDDVPEPPAEPITRPGDVWHLGPHRLVCGDATKAEDVALVMGGERADVVLTDPPYNVAYQGGTADQLTIANDDMAPDAYRRFLASALGNATRHLRPGGAFYVWHADVTALPVRLACADAGLTIRQGLVWVKSSHALGRQDYQWRHEPCLYGWADGAAHTWLSDRSQTTVLEFDKPARNADHPTTKPADLFAYLVRNSCPQGRTVLDPFAGSGTALVAAHTTGRVARLLELDPRYCDVITRRFENLTGLKAERRTA